MSSRGLHPAKAIGIAAAALALCGCMTAAPDATGLYVTPAAGAPATANDTAYSPALRCLANYRGPRQIRIAVGQIANETGGHEVTQGGALMAMSALAKAGVPLVERSDISASGLDSHDRPWPDYYLVGGITELNANLRSNVSAGSPSVMNIALDLRLVDAKTSEIADVISYQKQLLVSDWAREPVQLAVRAVIERAVFEMVSRLYAAPAPACGSPVASPAGQISHVDLAARSDSDPHSRLQTGGAVAPAYRERYVGSDVQNPTRFFTPTKSANEPRLRRRFD